MEFHQPILILVKPEKEEIWARGLRNPWKFSFSKVNGDLWIADVGQYDIEEINKIAYPVFKYRFKLRFRCYEGNVSYLTSGCEPMNTMTFPLAQYTHASGRCSITGGFFYLWNNVSKFTKQICFC